MIKLKVLNGVFSRKRRANLTKGRVIQAKAREAFIWVGKEQRICTPERQEVEM